MGSSGKVRPVSDEETDRLPHPYPAQSCVPGKECPNAGELMALRRKVEHQRDRLHEGDLEIQELSIKMGHLTEQMKSLTDTLKSNSQGWQLVKQALANTLVPVACIALYYLATHLTFFTQGIAK